jgi:DNA-binding NarL/FixJ family response regulator
MTTTSAKPIRLLIVDDHPLLREGVAAVLEDEPGVEVVAQATNGLEAIETFEKHLPDITFMDLQMPQMNGIDAIAAIRSRFPAARIVVLTTYKGDVSALRALRAGAVGYLLKDQLSTDLMETIRTVHAGGRRIPPEIAEALASHLGEDALSEREIQVLRSVAQGNSNKRVAAELGISEETVKGHMKSIAEKLNANDRTHAVTIALRRGILEL